MAFDLSDISTIDARARTLTSKAADPATAHHIFELVAALPDDRLARLQSDFELFEISGVITTQMDRILRRAECLADADRILSRLVSAD